MAGLIPPPLTPPPLIPPPLIPPGPPDRRVLGRVEDIPDGGAKGFPPAGPDFAGLFAVRRGAVLRVYVNSCPHLGLPLEWMADRFLSVDRSQIVCAAHGAAFRIEDGVCLHGPCYGTALTQVLIEINEGLIVVPAAAGRFAAAGAVD